jgi:hypothetical protein
MRLRDAYLLCLIDARLHDVEELPPATFLLYLSGCDKHTESGS